MRIKAIYQRFKIPPRLQDHLLRVGKTALFISKHWTGPRIEPELVKKAALLHDLGNIVKFDLERYPISRERDKAILWFKIKKDVTDKYGTDKHQATLKMLKELRVGSAIVKLIKAKSFPNAIKIEKSDHWELKILFYADLRAAPFGFLPVKGRLDEALSRLGKYQQLENLNEIVQACYQIEKQIQENTDVDVMTITDESVRTDDNLLLSVEV